MAAAWQQWMPLYIQRLKSNPFVIAMHPSARSGYIWLVTEQWQTDDCTLPSNIKTLKVMSGLGPYWDEHSEEIMERFTGMDGDRLRNDFCYELWMEAKAKYEEGQLAYEALKSLRSRSGRAGADKKWQNHGKRMAKDSKPIANACEPDSKPMAKDGFTYTDTYTDTEEQTLLASHPSGCSAETLFVELPTNRKEFQFPVFESHIVDWMALYPAVDARQQIRNMRGWLDGNPGHRKTLKGTPAFIHRWLSKAQDKGGHSGAQPSNAVGRGVVSPATQRVESGVNAFRQAAIDLGLRTTGGVLGADGQPVSAPGRGGVGDGLPVRLQSAHGEAWPIEDQNRAVKPANPPGPEILPPARRDSGGVGDYGR